MTSSYLGDKFNLISGQQTPHCILLSDIYTNNCQKLSDCSTLPNFKATQTEEPNNLNQISNELSKSANNLNNQIDLANQLNQGIFQHNTISQVELSNLNIQPNSECQYVYQYHDRLI